MSYITLVSGIVLVVLILLQVGNSGLNVALTDTLQAPLERRGAAKTLYISTIIVASIFVISAIVNSLFA